MSDGRSQDLLRKIEEYSSKSRSVWYAFESELRPAKKDLDRLQSCIRRANLDDDEKIAKLDKSSYLIAKIKEVDEGMKEFIEENQIAVRLLEDFVATYLEIQSEIKVLVHGNFQSLVQIEDGGSMTFWQYSSTEVCDVNVAGNIQTVTNEAAVSALTQEAYACSVCAENLAPTVEETDMKTRSGGINSSEASSNAVHIGLSNSSQTMVNGTYNPMTISDYHSCNLTSVGYVGGGRAETVLQVCQNCRSSGFSLEEMKVTGGASTSTIGIFSKYAKIIFSKIQSNPLSILFLLLMGVAIYFYVRRDILAFSIINGECYKRTSSPELYYDKARAIDAGAWNGLCHLAGEIFDLFHIRQGSRMMNSCLALNVAKDGAVDAFRITAVADAVFIIIKVHLSRPQRVRI